MTDPNAIFDSVFQPLEEVQKSTPDGAELMNRTGLRKPVKQQGTGKTGRPKKSGSRVHFHPTDPKLTNIVYKNEADSIIKSGSVLQVVLPDGKLTTLVMMSDVLVGTLAEPE